MDFLASIDESDDVDLDLTVEQECDLMEPNSNILGKPSKIKNTKRKLKSQVRKYFTMIEGLDNKAKKIAKYNACGSSYTC